MRGIVSLVVLSLLAVGAGGAAGVAQAQIPVTPVRAAYTVEPFTPPAQILIRGTGVRLRAEPFATTETPVLSAGSTGLVLNVVGIARMPDWNWYQVVLGNGQKAFIRSDLTSAPSRGGSSVPAVPVQPSSPTAIVSSSPVYQPTTPAYQPTAPSYQPTTPAYQPASPSSGQPAEPLGPPISLTPRSTLPAIAPDPPSARASDPSGLLSVPPGQ